MGPLLDLHDAILKRRTFGLLDDFESAYVSGDRWTSTLNGGATVTNPATNTNGLLLLSAVDSVQNRELYVATTVSPFLFAANRALLFEVEFQFAEANVNQGAFAFGFMNGVANGAIATYDLKTNFSGAAIYKIPGGTQWKTVSSVGTTQTITQAGPAMLSANDTVFHRLRIEIMPIGNPTSNLAEVRYFYDGAQFKDANNRLYKDTITMTAPVNMQAFMGLKNGSTTPETLTVDYVAFEQLRLTGPTGSA